MTGWVLGVIGNVVSWLLGLLPTFTPPDWLSTVIGFISTTVSQALALGNWIPWNLVGLGFVFVWLCFGIAFAIRVARIVGSFATAGGGSAG